MIEMKKRLLTLILTLALLAALWTPAAALIPKETNSVTCQVFTDGINNTYWDQATLLNKLDLLRGTGSGFALERGMTRAEAAAMLVRFLGEEKAALSQDWAHPFTDVPEWADRYVGWLYQNKLTKGTSDTKYSPSLYVTYWQYATFLSRACTGGDDFLAAGIGKPNEQALTEGNNSFLRAEAVALSTRTLGCYHTAGSKTQTMAQFLIGKNVFTTAQWFEAAPSIFPLYYQISGDEKCIEATLLDVPVAKSVLTGVNRLFADYNNPLPHFYAGKVDGTGALTLYQMDCLSLKETQLGRYPSDPSLPNTSAPYAEYLGTIGGADYLRIRQYPVCDLVRVVGAKAETVATRAKISDDYAPDTFVSDQAILVMDADDAVYVLTEKAAQRRPLRAGDRVVGLLENVAVVCRPENGKTTVEGFRTDTWAVTDTYTGLSGSGEASIPDLRQYGEPHDEKIYGAAGFYLVADGRLRQITARPTRAVCVVREGAGGAWVILDGQEIVRVGSTWEFGGDDTVLLAGDAPHGIDITGLKGNQNGSAVIFYSARGVGMEHYDVYTYSLCQNPSGKPAIYVDAFEAGRPEMMEHDEAWYVQREQARLNALGVMFSS